METANGQTQPSGGAAKVVQTMEDVSNVIGTLVPTVAAIGGAVRLILTAVKPSDAQKAQAFADASAQLKTALNDLSAAIDGFEAAKAAALGTGASASGSPAGSAQGGSSPASGGSGHSDG